MNPESKEGTAFEKRSREVLEESSARLDGRTLSRLTQARHAALEQASRPARQVWRWSLPAGAAAAAVLAVVLWMGRPPVSPSIAKSVDDFELLTDADAPDFVDDGEDVEFYEWAAGEMES
jgi:negative regulator of sigma E activity